MNRLFGGPGPPPKWHSVAVVPGPKAKPASELEQRIESHRGRHTPPSVSFYPGGHQHCRFFPMKVILRQQRATSMLSSHLRRKSPSNKKHANHIHRTMNFGTNFFYLFFRKLSLVIPNKVLGYSRRNNLHRNFIPIEHNFNFF